MSELVNSKNLSWIAKNKNLALIIALIFANGYQYVNTMKINEAHAIEARNWAKSKELEAEKSLEYERQRSEKLEFLLNNLSKYAPK